MDEVEEKPRNFHEMELDDRILKVTVPENKLFEGYIYTYFINCFRLLLS